MNERFLKTAQEYFEHDYVPHIGGVSLLTGALVWFYATDITRVFKVKPVFQEQANICLNLHFQHTAYRLGYQQGTGDAPISGPLEDTRVIRFMDGYLSQVFPRAVF
jgi:hypothetical protein